MGYLAFQVSLLDMILQLDEECGTRILAIAEGPSVSSLSPFQQLDIRSMGQNLASCLEVQDTHNWLYNCNCHPI